MSLRRSLLDLHRQSHNLSALKALPFTTSHISGASSTTTTTAVGNPIGRDLSTIPFALAQKLKPESTNRSMISSAIRQSDLEMAKSFSNRVQSSRGYTTRSYLPKLHVINHISEGMEEILADYVHQEMTRNFMVISLGIFQLIFIKDVLVFLLF